MLITADTLDALFKAYNAEYKTGLNAVMPRYLDVATKTKSSTEESTYPWLGQFPMLREWLGDRVIKSMGIHGFAIKNRKFESTVAVPRDKIEDDQYGMFAPVFQQMGRTVAMHPDTLIFPMLSDGFTSLCYDGQTFFNANHPAIGADGNGVDASGNPVLASNMQAGTGAPWFLFDTTQPFKALVWQERISYEFQQIIDPKTPHVIMQDEYIYGIRARASAGFALWQLAFGSKAELNPDNYAAARIAMQQLRGDQGQLLGISPNLLVCGPANEAKARKLLKATSIVDVPDGITVGAGVSNIWHESADLLVTPYL